MTFYKNNDIPDTIIVFPTHFNDLRQIQRIPDTLYFVK